MVLLELFWNVQNLFLLLILTLILWIWFVKLGPVCHSDTDLIGKTVLITGGNAGIGKATAIELAKRNARVIIACRNSEKAAFAVKEIRLKSGNDAVHCMKLDLADLDSVRDFSKEFLETEQKLDILINNAGVVNFGKTKQGFDLMFGTNQLGPFLLTNLLLPLLRKTSKFSSVRVVNVSSIGYCFGKIDLENLNPNFNVKSYFLSIFLHYCSTKLMNVYFTTQLDKKLRSVEFEDCNITTFAVHPGFIFSNFGIDLAKGQRGFLGTLGQNIFYFISGRSPYYGCQTTVHCCLDKGVEQESGKYFSNLKSQKLLSHATKEETGVKLWQKCEELCGLSMSNE